MTAESLPPWAARLIAEFTDQDARATAVAAGLTADQLNRQPRPGGWSVAQCLEHLAISNEQYLPPIADALEGRRAAVVQEITPGWFGRWFIRNVIEPPLTRRNVKSPGKIRPTSARIEPAVVERLLQGNATARDLVRRAAPLDVNRIRFRNPFVPLFRFTVGTGFEILSRHQRRHLAQAERARAALPG